MTVSKPEVVAWMWRDINGDVQFNYMHPNGEELIRLTDHEAAIAELQADRDQQYDMKVKAREQRDVVTAENQRLRKALTRHVCTGMTDAQRTAELERYLSDGIAADKARIKLLEEQRDSFTMHKIASRQCIGIPASVGVCEPVEGFADRPQDLAPAMREMALIIEADKARIAELEKRSEGLLGLYREAESELKQCVIDRASFSDELRACTESPGGCGYWREAAKHRTGERDHALARIAELEAYLALAKDQSLAIQAGIQLEKENTELLGLLRECREALASDGTANWMRALIARIDAALAQQGKEGET